MKKKLITIMLILTIICPLAYKDVYGEKLNYDMNSSEVIKYAETHNIDLKILKERIKIAEEKYADVEDGDYRKYKRGSTQIEKEKIKKVYPRETELELNDVKWEMKQKQHEVKLGVMRNYYSILIQDKLIEMKKNEIERIEKQIKQVKKEIEVGTIAEISLMDYELLLEQAQVELKSLNDNRQKIIMDLNISMGRDVDEKLIVEKEEIPNEEYRVDNLEQIIEQLVKNDYTVTRIKDEISIASLEYDVLDKYNKSDKYHTELEELDEKFDELRYDTESQKRELEYKLRTDYNNLLKQNNKLLMMQLDYENKKKLLEAAGTRQKLGYITEIEFKQYEQDVQNALQEYEKVKLDYYISVEEFKFFINQ